MATRAVFCLHKCHSLFKNCLIATFGSVRGWLHPWISNLRCKIFYLTINKSCENIKSTSMYWDSQVPDRSHFMVCHWEPAAHLYEKTHTWFGWQTRMFRWIFHEVLLIFAWGRFEFSWTRVIFLQKSPVMGYKIWNTILYWKCHTNFIWNQFICCTVVPDV